MVRAPGKETREAIKFWVDCLQVVAIMVSVVGITGATVWEQQAIDIANQTKTEIQRRWQ